MPGQLTNSAGVRIQKRDDPRQRPERRFFLVRMLAVGEQLNEDGLKAEKALVHGDSLITNLVQFRVWVSL